MRLTQLKLAGFKSFVDPTSFAVPSRLVGVVGPNGCGKSNIIDAVRWVLGESKASELRGESMQDVIFNGSTQRKPASRASVELVFDNSEARAGGQWNQFAEIAVKRVLTRDGASTYYINGQSVRRRDVQDIFLGTGLGPRAYAIIGQGMIARIIEARPEDLRVFLEEAAGVSKYKERRRETENRLNDTRDNLTRVEDILRELGSSIEKLEQQAEVARRYHAFDEERVRKQQWLWLIRWREGQDELNSVRSSLEALRAELEAFNAQSIHAQTEVHILRERQFDRQQAVDAEQQRLVEINRQISRLEGDLRVMAEGRQRLAQRVAELLAQQAQWQARAEQAEERGQSMDDALAEAAAATEEALIRSEQAQAACEPAEKSYQQAKQDAEQARAKVVDIQQSLKLIAQRRETAERAIQQLEIKRERLQADERQIESPDNVLLLDAERQAQELTEALAEAQLAKEAADEMLPQAEAQAQAAVEQARRDADQRTALAARLEALQQLQAQVEANSALAPWLQAQGLQDQSTVMERLRVETGWERAIEAVLAERLRALELGQLDTAAGFLATPPTGSLAFVRCQDSPECPVGPDDLAARCSSTDPALMKAVAAWLHGARVATSLSQALAQRSQLALGQFWVTVEGHQVSRETVRFYAETDATAGALARRQEIEQLERAVRAGAMLVDSSEEARRVAQSALTQAQQRQRDAQAEVLRLTKAVNEAQLQHLKLSEANARAQQKLEQVQMSMALLADELTMQQEVSAEAEAQWGEADEYLAEYAEQHEAAQQGVLTAEARWQDLQRAAREAERAWQQAQYDERAMHSEQQNASRDGSFAREQQAQVVRQLDAAQTELADLQDEEIQAQLQIALDQRLTIEDALSQARALLDELMGQVRAAEEAEREGERRAQPLRDQIQAMTLKEQAAQLTIEQFDGHLTEVQADRAALATSLAELPQQPRPSALQADVTRLQQSIQALGPVNLAALDELTAASERKLFLDQQCADLQLAMTTLQDAIARIDQETRHLLQTTFDTVNGHFSRLFPQLFGGGEARLVMSGEELLDAGVQVFAQPPGKKNGTIHLLSGGEKALTATALVFAIFELNPAPFCLLDEVDAPLDDANTERFCRLVKKMSEQTQFLFISHNKIAMAIAEQLIGVTMQEKGVSRIVAVDLEAAEQMMGEAA